jgi:hypothetical protein
MYSVGELLYVGPLVLGATSALGDTGEADVGDCGECDDPLIVSASATAAVAMAITTNIKAAFMLLMVLLRFVKYPRNRI